RAAAERVLAQVSDAAGQPEQIERDEVRRSVIRGLGGRGAAALEPALHGRVPRRTGRPRERVSSSRKPHLSATAAMWRTTKARCTMGAAFDQTGLLPRQVWADRILYEAAKPLIPSTFSASSVSTRPSR
ncbi:hypothetical protein, partial [Streptomyces sp. NPDC006333]|uniref:hypothetical protein n=1 Tax=Streptomyces sp. NPDC006333 TaxID=3156753 RepID=UPI00339E089C